MKSINNINELETLTKSELQSISTRLFNSRLRGDKADFLRQLYYNFNNYGNLKYDVILINIILSGKLILSDEIIDDNQIIATEYRTTVSTYDKFLYKYHLGFKALFEKYKDDLYFYTVNYSYIFDNQFNTVCGKRILDWDVFIIPSKGYEDLKITRDNTFKCGYCGKQYTKEEAQKVEFCTKCRGSEYLKEDDYHLLKLRAVSDKKSYKDVSIPAHFLEDIKEQQIIKNKAKILKDIERKKETIANKIKANKREIEVLNYLLSNDGFNFLHGFYIYYSHSDTLSFKWNERQRGETVLKLILDNKSKIENDLKIKVEV